MQQRKEEYRPFIGGLDTETTDRMVSPRRARLMWNMECKKKGGTRRVGGFERIDGQAKASTGLAKKGAFRSGIREISVGDTITGAQSGESAVVLEVTITSGDWATSDAEGDIVVTRETGALLPGETVTIQSQTDVYATIDSTPADVVNDFAEMLRIRGLAHEELRAKIGKPPGSGPVRGMLRGENGETYAFRDNAGGTAGLIYKATAAGWTAVDLGQRIEIHLGTEQIIRGDTITGVTSGATAVVGFVAVKRDANGDPLGTWTDDDWAGYLHVHSITGTFANSEVLNVAAVASATTVASSAVVANTRQPGGRIRRRWHNFFGADGWDSWWCADGVNAGFAFDGSTYAAISTGMADDTPNRVGIFGERLIFTFGRGSLQRSVGSDPFGWNVVLGAGELGLGETITDLYETVSAVFVSGDTKTKVLYSESGAWRLEEFSDSRGSIADTMQEYETGIFGRKDGISTLATSQRHGNFASSLVSDDFSRVWDDLAPKVCGSSVHSKKNQYRVYGSDGTGISTTFNKSKIVGFGTFSYGVDIFTVETGLDGVVLMGCEDGYVREVDSGPSYDGQPVLSIYRTPFDAMGSPNREKRFLYSQLEIKAEPGIEVRAQAEFSFSDIDESASIVAQFNPQTGGKYWNISWDWNVDSYWGMPVVYDDTIDIPGAGQNMAILIVSETTYGGPLEIDGALHYFQLLRVAA